MQLTADMFMEIVQSLRSDGLHNGMREQRKAPRVGVRGRTTIMIPTKTGSKLIPANVRDLSAGGIGLLLAEPLLSKGEEFILILPPGESHGRSGMLCVVRRSAKVSETMYTIGASFLNEMKDMERFTQLPAATGTAAVSTAKPAKPAATPVVASQTASARAAVAAQVNSIALSQPPGSDLMARADTQVMDELEARLKALSN